MQLNPSQIRAIALSAVQREREQQQHESGVSTTGDTPTDVLTFPTLNDTGGVVQVIFIGQGTDGNVVAGIRLGTYKNIAGTVAILGYTAVGTDIQHIVGAGTIMAASGTDVVVRVVGVAAYPMNWRVTYSFISVTTPIENLG